jgi:hypothetical protein
MIKLYLPYGNLRAFSGREQVTLHWFRTDRTEPVAPYPGLILGYGQMSPEQQRSAERMVNELLTEEEYRALRDYLQTKKRADLRIGVLVAPVNALKPANELGLGLVRPFGAHVDGEGGGFYRLSEDPDYTLPFSVWGYYSRPTR